MSNLCYMKGFCELSTKALGNMGCLTINTRSNRVLIITSVITRIFFNSVQCLDGHISTCFNKDTCDLFMLCIMLVCHLYRVDLLLLSDFYSSFVHPLFDFCFHLILLLFIVHCSLFKEKDSILILDCIQGILILLYHCTRSIIIIYASQINIIHQTAPTLS